jgi:hypothetical protein
VDERRRRHDRGPAPGRDHGRPFGVVPLLDTALGGPPGRGRHRLLRGRAGRVAGGTQTFTCALAFDGDQVAANDRDSLSLYVGPGPLDITEIQFHPQHAEGEWVEVRNRTSGPLDLTGFTLSDRGRARGRLSAGVTALAAESLAVLAQDRRGLLARFPGLDSTRVLGVSPWSSLNNANDTTGVADVVTLRESDETPCARQPYSASGIPAGVPIERSSEGEWRAALDPDGSPLRPPRAPAPLVGRFDLVPRRARQGTTLVRLAWSLPWNRARASVDVYDLSGARVAHAVSENLVSGRAEREWPIQNLAPGLYVVVLRARAESGSESLSESRTLRVDGATP